MSAWISLMKKELRLGLSAFLVPIIAFLVVIGIASYLGSRNGFGWEAVVFVAMFATGIQVFYMIYYLLYSLQTERKVLHLWLHSPMPGYGLLSAKLVSALAYMLFTCFITGTTLFIAVNQSVSISEQLQFVNIAEIGMFGGLHLILLAVHFAIVFMFFWIIFLVLNRNLGSFVSFLSTFVIFIIATTLYSAFTETGLYAWLTQWGELHFSGITESINITTNFETGTEVIQEAGYISLYLGFYFFEAVVAILLFLGAWWLLDRKVEV
ncbi:hypothetical protein BkAM31D_19775 [Halalkalibacter krulwichiae]|uniref:ABC-2 family transporter protein n=2 Tax=Halalkalibacter krulwichiae TaxID=199441 RepID=A0A1X9MEN4_9BACI|nr:hypothetical protein [Halalkalibacter krulwichiae]ARK31898.1 hypothetical protein BkAM31D_19775 [Halalkalibacter krulwichiae]